MRPALLVVLLVALVVGAALVAGAIVFGLWLRRSDRTRALKTYIWASVSGALAFCAAFAAILITLVVERRHVSLDQLERHPASVILVIGLWLLTLLAAAACALFGIWTLGRLLAARQVRTTPA